MEKALPTVSVNPPKTPVTEGSQGIAAATLPNVCKMPGSPAPFVPVPLPNIGKSAMSPKDFSTKVKVEGKEGANQRRELQEHGRYRLEGNGRRHRLDECRGSDDVHRARLDGREDSEGKNVQLLGDQMLNNCGPAGSPANAATMMGLMQATGAAAAANAQPRPGHEVGDVKHPDTDEEFKDRRNALARDHSPGGEHEHKAAQHNESGILRAEGALSRENPSGPKKSAVSGEGSVSEDRARV